MMDWKRPGRLDRFEYLRVSLDGRVLGRLSNITGGQISENLNTGLKASGVITAVGGLDVGNDLVRIELVSTLDGEEARVALGTFFVATPVAQVTDTAVTVDADLYSTLLVLDEGAVQATYSIPAGTNALAHARALVEAVGLTVIADDSSAITTVASTFEAGTSYLEIVNHLLDFAGFGSAQPDGYGRVVMRPYADPTSRQPIWTFTDADGSSMLPELEDELDWFHTPNVVVVTMSNEEEGLIAVAKNTNPASPTSTVSRGREIVRCETVDDAPSQAALQAKADALLVTSSQLLQRITLKHAFAPVALGDVVAVRYTAAGIDYTLTVRTRDLDLSPGVPTTTETRRFIR